MCEILIADSTRILAGAVAKLNLLARISSVVRLRRWFDTLHTSLEGLIFEQALLLLNGDGEVRFGLKFDGYIDLVSQQRVSGFAKTNIQFQ